MSIDTLIPPDEKDAYACISANHANLFRFEHDIATSIALFEFLERGGGPPSTGVLGGQFAQWRMIVARDIALNVYHFGCSLDAVKKQLAACPTLNKHVDSAAVRNAIKAFNKCFPNTAVIRHAIAHAGEMQKSPSKMRENILAADARWHGGAMAAGGLLGGSIYEQAYAVGWKDKVFSMTFNQNAIDCLATIRALITNVIQTATDSLAAAQPPPEN